MLNKQAVINRYNNLEPMISIADDYGVTRQAIYKVLRIAGVDTTKRLLQVECKQCGKAISRQKGRVRNTINPYCSMDCYHQAIKSNYKPSRQGQRIGRRIVGLLFDLLPSHIVHHEDKDQGNNNPDNLMAFKSQAEHMSYHRGGKGQPIWIG